MKLLIGKLLVLLFLVQGCASQKVVSVGPSSETGRIMSEVDASARNFQNRGLMTSHLSKFEGDSECNDVKFREFIEPGAYVSSKVTNYDIIAASDKCGTRNYSATVHFKDAARTVIKKIDNVQVTMEEEFEVILDDFIASASDSDLEKMVSLTSSFTIKKIGLKNLKAHYENDTSRAIKSCENLVKSGDSIYISINEAGTGSGWVFRKTCTFGNGESVGLRFVLLNENQKIVVTSVGLD